VSTYRSNQYRMHSAGFDRRAATRGQWLGGDPEVVDSDDGIDYIDWDALREQGYPKGVELTYRVIGGVTVRFRDGVPL
jgi:hypothetical protein